MGFFDDVDQAQELLSVHGRVSLRALRRAFGDTDDLADEIAHELVVRGVAVREGETLVSALASSGRPDGLVASVRPGNVTAAARSELAPNAEIRHLTLVFCDVIGSTELSGRLDAESWTGAMRAALTMAADCIERRDGHVSAYLGDGLLSFFGYPVAQEDAGERAVSAALAILDGLPALNETIRSTTGMDLSMRIGIHTGPVVVDEVGGIVQANGRTTNIAARVESVAPPDSVVVTPSTLALVPGLFLTDELGSFDLKGVDEPVTLTRIRGRVDPTQVQDRAARPVIGRDEERIRIAQSWDRLERHRGQVVALVGDPGIGKSWLVDAFRESLREQQHTWLDVRCSAFASAAPLEPVVQLVRRSIGISERADASEIAVAIERALGDAGLGSEREVGLLSELLAPGGRTAGAAQAEMRRVELLEFLADWLLAVAAEQPTVLFIEDYHWADPTTRELLDRVASEPPAGWLLVLVATRPELAPAWDGAHVARLELDRLAGEPLADLIRSIGGSDLDDDTVRSIIERSGGIPFFAAELTAAATRGDQGHSAVTDSLENLLMSRFELHPGLRDLAQTASVIGAEFTTSDLSLLVDLATVEPILIGGVEVGVFVPTHDTTYAFRHVLARDAAYESMLGRTRRERHQRFANGLLSTRPDVTESRPDLVARHLSFAGVRAPASLWWERAAARARGAAANPESMAYYQRAIDDADVADAVRLLDLHLSLAGAMAATLGHAHRDITAVWEKVTELAELVDDRWALAAAKLGLRSGSVAKAEFDRGQEDLAQQAFVLARSIGADDIVTAVDLGAIMAAHFRGWPLRAIDLCERSFASGLQSSKRLDELLGVPVDMLIRAHYSYVLGMVGRFTEAYEANAQIDAEAERIGPGPSTQLLSIQRAVYALDGDLVAYARMSEEFFERAQRYGLGYAISLGRCVALATRATISPSPEQLVDLRRASDRLTGSGSLIAAPFMLWMLGGAELACGRPDLAEGSISFGQDLAVSTGQQWYDPQLLVRKLEAQRALGRLPSDWEERTVEMADFAAQRTLRVGGLLVGMFRLEQSRATAAHTTTRRALGDLLDDLPDTSPNPLRRRVEAMLAEH